MKPWQAWTITICAILICIVQLYQGIYLAVFDHEMGELAGQLEKDTEKFEKDWNTSIKRAKEEAEKAWLPEKPKGRATYNPPR